jgi:DNA-binding HxlR family transcriptional regulator
LQTVNGQYPFIYHCPTASLFAIGGDKSITPGSPMEQETMKKSTSPSVNVPLPGIAVRGSSSGRPLMATLDLLGRRWVLRLIWEMREKPCGFRELQANCEGLSPSVLSKRLKELQLAGVVEQDDDARWLLTPLGKSLQPAIKAMSDWSKRWEESLNQSGK